MSESAAFQGFQFVQGAGPVGFEQAGETAIGEKLAASLAGGAVVRLIVGKLDALDGAAATGTGLVEAAVHGHFGAECGDFLGKSGGSFRAKAGDPGIQGLLEGVVELRPVGVCEAAGELHGGEPGGVENLVGVGVAAAGEDARVGEGALEGAIFPGEGQAEGFEAAVEDFQAAGVDFSQGGFRPEEEEGCAPFGASFRQLQRSGGEVKSGEGVAAGELGCGGTPVEAAGNHEVQDEPDVVFEAEGDALADAAQAGDALAFGFADGRVDGAEEEEPVDTDGQERLAEHPGLKGGEVGHDVGEFRHGTRLRLCGDLRKGELCAEWAGEGRILVPLEPAQRPR